MVAKAESPVDGKYPMMGFQPSQLGGDFGTIHSSYSPLFTPFTYHLPEEFSPGLPVLLDFLMGWE